MRWKREKAEVEKGHAWGMCWYILNATGPCRPLIKQYSDLFLFLENCSVPPVGLWCPEVIRKELGQAITKARRQWRAASLLVRESRQHQENRPASVVYRFRQERVFKGYLEAWLGTLVICLHNIKFFLSYFTCSDRNPHPVIKQTTTRHVKQQCNTAWVIKSYILNSHLNPGIKQGFLCIHLGARLGAGKQVIGIVFHEPCLRSNLAQVT